MSQPTWALGPDEIQLWSVSLTRSEAELARLRELLSEEEYARACCYKPRHVRDQYVTARGVLRLILGSYLGLDPARVRFETSNTGKPRLPGGGLYFNVTHSHQMGLIAVTRHGEVGVDIEHVRPISTFLDMAERYFTPGEVAALRRLPPGAREQAFFHTWTRKEAFLKATGLGLSHGLERFEVSVPPDDPARILHIDGDHTQGQRWSMTCLEPAPGYVGAVAVEEHGLRLVPRRYDE
ncbi:MAG: 4'-phosphopantetheinyl transferase superfamily protein [Gemmataceae bacterium]